jgi:FdhD protein
VSGRHPQRASELSVPVERLGASNAGGAAAAIDARGADDRVVVEEPLEVRFEGRCLLVTMRTPGDDLDLVRGLLFTEGLVRSPEDVAAVAHCQDVPAEAAGNAVTVSLRQGASLVEENALRQGLITSACGVCGKAALDVIAKQSPRVGPGPRLDAALIARLPGLLRDGQQLFAHTGGLHAAALFSAQGALLALAEDVGRHNAVDKVVGRALRFAALPLADTLLLVSGRAGFEIVYKARRAGIPVVASVSAPSSLSIELARDGGQTLIGFLREGRFNVYCGGQRFDSNSGTAGS